MAASESSRARRFALPALQDDRADEAIEAFLEGRQPRRGRRNIVPAQPAPAQTGEAGDAAVARRGTSATAFTTRPAADLRSLPGRLEWNAAIERESLRAARYSRPAAVAIVEVRPQRNGADTEIMLKMLVGPVARVLRRDSRATDLVARVGSGRFQVLLPETTAAGADQYAERIGATCRTEAGATGAAVIVRVCVAAASRGHSLSDAVEEATKAIEAA